MRHPLYSLLPEYPRTRHLPYEPNAKRDDLVCTEAECRAIWTQPTSVQEKVDGSGCRMTIHNLEPVIGNRNHLLNKAEPKARNASKAQFSSVFNWWYEHYGLFRSLAEAGPYSVYGDWMYMQHGMPYDLLPSLFIAYDVFDYENHRFVDVGLADTLLRECGFAVAPLLHYGPVENPEQLIAWANERSAFSTTERREGVYLKVCDGRHVMDRFKMVRPGFEQGRHFDRHRVLRNKVVS